MKIPTMIVDDQTDIRMLLRLIIERANDGLTVAGEADSGRAAIDRYEELDPAVVVIDQMMPGMTGLDAVKDILAGHPDAKFILCTAYLDEALVARAESIGVFRCVNKAELKQLPDAIREAAFARSA